MTLPYDDLCRTWDPWSFVPPFYNLGVALTHGQVVQGRGDKPALLFENAAGQARSLTRATPSTSTGSLTRDRRPWSPRRPGATTWLSSPIPPAPPGIPRAWPTYSATRSDTRPLSASGTTTGRTTWSLALQSWAG